ncbi:MAG: hypothetical protein JJ891_14235 [Rhizobiaceae bacterium]|nr:hypothetical protein [Rhizobiaceae bacterium]
MQFLHGILAFRHLPKRDGIPHTLVVPETWRDRTEKGTEIMNILGNITSATRALMRAREKQAQLSVHAYLAQFDDESLNSLGVKRSQLKRGGSVNHFI